MYTPKQQKPQQSRIIHTFTPQRRPCVAQFIRIVSSGTQKPLLKFLSDLNVKDKIEFFECYCERRKKKDCLILNGQKLLLQRNDLQILNNITFDKYLELITENIRNADYWITWPTYATGDMTSLSVMLINSSHGVIIYKERNYGGEINKAMMLWKSFLGGEIVYNKYLVTKKGWQGLASDKIEPRNLNGFSFTSGTEYVSKEWNAKLRRNIRKIWGITEKYDIKIEKWLNDNNIDSDKYKNKDIVVLWIRKSGENGGAHYENDTSFRLLEKLISKNSNKVYYLAGDDTTDAMDISKAAKLTKYRNVVNITKIWEKKNIEQWMGNTRTGQFNIYDFLKRHSKSLLHIGAMSGNLEAMALLGHKTMFQTIDDRDSNPSLRRMLKYDKHDEKVKEKNKIGYNFKPLKHYEKSTAQYYMLLRYNTSIIHKKLQELISVDYLYNKKLDVDIIDNIVDMYYKLPAGRVYNELKDKNEDSTLSSFFIQAAKMIKKNELLEQKSRLSTKRWRKMYGKKYK